MSIKLRKQSAGAVPPPDAAYVQLFVDVDGQLKIKNNEDLVTSLVPSGTGLMPHPGLIGNPAVGEFVFGDGTLITLPVGAVVGNRAGVYLGVETNVTVPAGQLLFWGNESVTGPSPITLPAGAYAEWVFCALDETTSAWVPAGASNEGGDGGGGGGAGLPYGGNQNDCVVGSWVSTWGSPSVTIPSVPNEGDTIGLYVQADTTPKSIDLPPNTVLLIGEVQYADEETVPLRNGAYYEWSALDDGEGSMRWVPRASHHTEPAPLTRRNPGSFEAVPNEWALASDWAPLVRLPQAPRNGDCYGVFVDVEDVSVQPRTGQSIVSVDGLTTVTNPGTLNVDGTNWYEWIWVQSEAKWWPRQNVLKLNSDAVFNAITNDTRDVFDVGDKALGSVRDPEFGTQAATKSYVDTLVDTAAPYSHTVVLGDSVQITNGPVAAFTFPIPASQEAYAFEFHLTIEQQAPPGGVLSISLNGDVVGTTNLVGFSHNTIFMGPSVNTTPKTTMADAVFMSSSNPGSPCIDNLRGSGHLQVISSGGFRWFPATLGSLVLRADTSAGPTYILSGSWGRVWKGVMWEEP